METKYNFISLIPKKEGEKSVVDFCLISLLWEGYMIIVEVLDLRLKSVIKKLVSKFQITGVEGRQN